jgi:hypothetical protein
MDAASGSPGRRGQHAGKDRADKARNHSRVAWALPHSEEPSECIAYGHDARCQSANGSRPFANAKNASLFCRRALFDRASTV